MKRPASIHRNLMHLRPHSRRNRTTGTGLFLLTLLAGPASAQFSATYHGTPDLDSPVLEREDEVVDFDWGPGAPDASLPSDGFSVRWEGEVVPAADETYTFYLTHDDGARLWVDGQLLLDSWQAGSTMERFADVPLALGQAVLLEVEYQDLSGESSVRLEWSSPSTSRRLVSTGRQGGIDSLPPFSPYFGGVFPDEVPGQGDLTAAAVSGDLGLGMILTMTLAPGSDLLHLGSRDGRLIAVDPQVVPITPPATPLLDISDRVFTGIDSGLLGVAFHPEYGTPGADHEGELFTYYIHEAGTDQFLRLSRFQKVPGEAVISPATEEVLIQQRITEPEHRGGGLAFGLDGYLYVTVGELGLLSLAQELDQQFTGCVLRIDVDDRPGSLPITVSLLPGDPDSFNQGYSIPADNPFIAAVPGALEELYAIGLRNPHRLTVDEVSGSILIGDVGTAGPTSREEVNLLAAGANYGWPFRIGTADIDARPTVIHGTLTDPQLAYPRDEGSCVIGGHVYRGSQIPWLQGRYVFTDWGNGALFAGLDEEATGPHDRLGQTGIAPVTLGEDSLGELYVAGGEDSVLYRVESAPIIADPPSTLSATGVFDDLATLEINGGFLPYDVNSPLWSDGALKRRWIGLPHSSDNPAPWEKIRFALHDEWQFPAGAVFVKHFELPLADGTLRRLETRFMVHTAVGKYYGVTYRWRPDGSDADLLAGTLTEDVGDGVQWTYPGRDDCTRCHNPTAGFVLGLDTAQLNLDYSYNQTGRTANQLITLERLGFFREQAEQPAFEPAQLDAAPVAAMPADPTAFLEERIRGYIDMNCASCHRPDGMGRGAFDARLSTPLGLQHLVDGELAEELDLVDPRVVVPQDPDRSMLLHRMIRTDDLAMPPLGRGIVHDEGVELLRSWIQAVNPVPEAFSVEFFVGSTLTTPVHSTTTSALVYDWTSEPPVPGVPDNDFSLRATTEIVAPESELFTFHVTADDGARLWVAGELLLDTWDSSGLREWSVTRALSAGQSVPLVLEYREKNGFASLRLDWSSASLTRRAVQGVLPGNQPPIAFDQQVVAPRDGELLITLEGSDVESAGVDVAVRALPQHGTLGGLGPTFTYRPSPGYEGPDSFTFVTRDGGQQSSEATVSIDVECLDCGSATSYCETSPNSAGPGARIFQSGSLSVAANDLVLQVEDCVPMQFGVFYYGAAATQVPFGDGLRCVASGGAGLARLAPQQLSPGGTASAPLDITTPPFASAQITSGSTWYFQFWYRDPQGGPSGFNLSDGLEIFFAP